MGLNQTRLTAKLKAELESINPDKEAIKENWNKMFTWFHERAEAFYNSFSKRVISLDLEDDEAA